MKNDLHISPWLLWAVSLVALLFAQGHGGGTPQVVDQPVGALRVTVWTAPEEPRVGQPWHITVALYRPGEGQDQPVTQARVQARLTPPNGGAPQTLTLEHADKVPPVFEVDLVPEHAGVWQVEVLVDAAEGQGTVSFQQTIAPASATGQRLLILAGAALLLAAGGWLWFRRR